MSGRHGTPVLGVIDLSRRTRPERSLRSRGIWDWGRAGRWLEWVMMASAVPPHPTEGPSTSLRFGRDMGL